MRINWDSLSRATLRVQERVGSWVLVSLPGVEAMGPHSTLRTVLKPARGLGKPRGNLRRPGEGQRRRRALALAEVHRIMPW